MARGWESKSVEDQVQNAETKIRRKGGESLTTAQIETRRLKDVLILSRTRVLRDLHASQDQRYKEQLNKALADIESQIAALKD